MMTIARVELDVPVPGPFDYATGDADVRVGALVAVPFGRRRQVGVVTAPPPAGPIPKGLLDNGLLAHVVMGAMTRPGGDGA